MPVRVVLYTILLCLFLGGCATPASKWRGEAQRAMDEARLQGGERRFPADYKFIIDSLEKGESLFAQGDVNEADRFYHEAIQKSVVLKKSIAAELAREEARQIEEANKRELAKALEEEKQRLAAAKEVPAQTGIPAQPKKEEHPKPLQKEKPLPSYYTVKRGETLPQIASRADIYDDPYLWPLIYRANRDQIRDPRRIWPGQYLKIPRNSSRDEMAEARRFAQEKQMP